MLEIKNNQVILDLNMIKKQRQQNFVKSLVANENFSDLFKYLKSFNGERAYNIYRPKLYKNDSLSDKKALSILDLQKKMINTNASHKPFFNADDYFGIEIECFIPRYDHEDCSGSGCDDCRQGYATGDECRDILAQRIERNKIKYCSVKSDGSIHCDDDHFPVELTILTRFSDTSNLKKLCDLLSKLDAKVNKSCGLHVHLDSRHLTSDQVIELGKKFKKALPVLTAMVPQSRRGNSYCLNKISKLTGSRYCAVNLTAFKKYRTVEIRLHSSTTDFNKIVKWATLLNAIRQADIKKTCNDINDLTNFIKIDENLMEYVAQRTELFSSKQNKSVSDDAIDHDSQVA